MDRFYLKVIYRKKGRIRYISHRDLTGVLKRSLKRADLSLAYSQGYNPRPTISFYNPLQLGITSECEIFLVELTDYVDPDRVREKWNECFPEGLECKDVNYVRNKKSVKIYSSCYRVALPQGLDMKKVNNKIDELSCDDTYIIKERNNKKVMTNDKLRNQRIIGRDLLFDIVKVSGPSLSPLSVLKFIFGKKTAVALMFSMIRYDVKMR